MELENKTKKIFVIIVLVLSFIPFILFIIYYQYPDEINSALGIKKDDLNEKNENENENENEKKRYRSPSGKLYPYHWGAPPQWGTRDIRSLPYGYGRGSSTLKKWIDKNWFSDSGKAFDKVVVKEKIKAKVVEARVAMTRGKEIKKERKPFYKYFEDNFKLSSKYKDKKNQIEIGCSIRNEIQNYVSKNQCIPECKKIKDEKIRKTCIEYCKMVKMVPFDKKEILINEIKEKDPLVYLSRKMNPFEICSDKNCKKYSNSEDKGACNIGCMIQGMCKHAVKVKHLVSKKRCIPECEKNKDYIDEEGTPHKLSMFRESCIDDCRSYQ